MSGANMGSDFRHSDLLPHQDLLLQRILDPNSQRVIVLQAAPGLGKSVALVEAVKRLLSTGPNRRVLLLSSPMIAKGFVERLRSEHCPAGFVGRYEFRVLRNAVAHNSTWPEGMVAVSFPFAMRPEVISILASVPWDLVIVDDIDLSNASRGESLRVIGGLARRIIISGTSRASLLLPFENHEICYVHWKFSELLNQLGAPLIGPPPEFDEIYYSLYPEEMEIATAVESVCAILDSNLPEEGKLVGWVLRDQLGSSPAALDAGLRALQFNSFRSGAAGEQSNGDTERTEDMPYPRFADSIAGKAAELAQGAINLLERQERDSKAERLVTFVADRLKKDPHQNLVRVCVVTKYLQTQLYIAAVLEKHKIASINLHSIRDKAKTAEQLATFEESGGVLCVTESLVRQGLDIPEVEHLCLYEMPRSGRSGMAVISAFDGLGRKESLRIAVFIPENTDSLGFVSRSHELRDAIAARREH